MKSLKDRSYNIDVLTERTFSESKIDMILFEKVIDNLDILKNDIGLCFDPIENRRMEWAGTKTILEKIFNKRKEKIFSIKYRPSTSSKKGRHFSKVPSLQGMCRTLRHLICKENYVDVDVVNCHVIILVQLCETYNFDCKDITYYVNNREQCLKELIDLTGKDRDNIKQQMLSLLNGGMAMDIFRCGSTEFPEWLIKFKDQIVKIHENFASLDDFKDFKKDVLKNKEDFNINGKITNKVLCMYENIIIQHVINFCDLNSIEVASNQFDGVILDKENIQNYGSDEFLCKLKQFILENVGCDIDFVYKEMNEGDVLYEKLKNLKSKREIKLEELRKKEHEKEEEKRKRELEKEEEKRKRELEKEEKEEEKKKKLEERRKRELEKKYLQDERKNDKERKLKENEEKAKPIPLLSDENIAKVFLDRIKKDYRHCKNNDLHYQYNEDLKLWESIKVENLCSKFSDIIIPYIDEIIENDDACAAGGNVSSIQEEIFEKYKTSIQSTKTQRDILFQVKNNLPDNSLEIQEKFDTCSHLFPFKDKVYDFKENNFRDRIKEDYFTITTNNEFIPPEHPDYIEQKEKLYKYIREILKTDDEKYVNSFLTLLSNNLTNDNSIKFITVMLGEGDNGKSLFLELLNSIYQSFSVKCPRRLFIQGKSESVLTTELKPLVKKRFGCISELSQNEKFNDTLLKSISGDDKYFQIRMPSSDGYFEVLIMTKLCIITNFMSSSNDPVFQKRLCYINFPNKFEKSQSKKIEILGLKNILFTELCNFASQLVKNNYIYVPCEQMISFTNEKNEDIKTNGDIHDFFEVCIEITNNNKDRLRTSLLCSIYKDWCSLSEFPLNLTYYRNSIKEPPYNLSRQKNNDKFIKTKGIEYFCGLKEKLRWRDNYETKFSADDDFPFGGIPLN